MSTIAIDRRKFARMVESLINLRAALWIQCVGVPSLSSSGVALCNALVKIDNLIALLDDVAAEDDNKPVPTDHVVTH